MALYIVQHGKALSKQEDPARPLTDEGRAEVSRIAAALNTKNIAVDKIIHSGKERAADTADIIRTELNLEIAVESMNGLGPNDDITPLTKVVNSGENIMIVGHLPYLSKLISVLVAGNPAKSVVNVRNGGVTALSKDENGWAIDWILVP